MKLGPFRLWDRFVISNRMSGDDSAYITRLRIIDTPWFGIFLHDIHRPDAQPLLHDHPWSFVSFVLRGSYIERYRDPKSELVKVRRVRRFNRKRLIDAHYITAVQAGTRTLVIVGPTRKTWGYWELQWPGEWKWTRWDQHEVHQPISPATAGSNTRGNQP